MTTSLSELSQQLHLWREQAKQGRIPHRLKQQVLGLMSQHSAQELSRHLGLKIKTVREWQKQTEIKDVKFVPLKTELTHHTLLSDRRPTVTVLLPNGTRLILSGQTIEELIEFTVILSERMKP